VIPATKYITDLGKLKTERNRI